MAEGKTSMSLFDYVLNEQNIKITVKIQFSTSFFIVYCYYLEKQRSLGGNMLINEKERLINMFFNIGRNENTDSLKRCLSHCERYLLSEDCKEIKNLINVMNALIILFEKDEKEEAKSWVNYLWLELNSKNNLSLFEIRILNCLLFIEQDIEELVRKVSIYLKQLEAYRFHTEYPKIKIIINLNLIILLVESKFYDKPYKNEYDELVFRKITEVISLTKEYKINDTYYVILAQIYEAILLKDDIKIYTGLLNLQNSSENYYSSIQRLIKRYVEKYSISRSQHTSLIIQTINKKFDVYI